MDIKYRPVALIILDGWGAPDDNKYSAKALAKTPFFDSLMQCYPSCLLTASGEAVGLPEGQMGNSEVGHLNVGAGRIVYQDYTRINLAIREGALQKNGVLLGAMDKAAAAGTALHFMGLLSDGGVHSDEKHLYALLRMAADRGVGRIFVHAFMDGRDTPPRSGLEYMKALYDFIGREKLGDTVKVATVSGRYYAMDRDNRWDRVKLAYDAMAGGEGRVCSSGVDAMEQAYSLGENDEFVHPSVVHEAGVPVGSMKDGDCAVFFNFRTDRTRELTRALAIDKFDGFGREGRLKFAEFVCMTEYDATFNLPVAFPPQSLDNILGEVISKDGLAQLRIAETEKYAHVTFFFNGGNEKPFPGEERVLIPSPKEVATYDLKPEMSAPAVTDELLARIASGKYDVIVLNYANPDMVGHTGIMEAAVRACEVVDGCLSRIVPAILAAGGVALVTADHGNCEKMYDNATHAPHTAHTSNPVPFIVTRAGLRLEPHGILADIAPTMLDIMGLAKPEEMTGRSLIIKS